jgi:putative ABC transport system ATP-binding protein
VNTRVAVELRGLAKGFEGDTARQVLQDLSLQVDAGEYVAIMGESGSGKSTLLNLIAGLDRPDSGTVLIDGVDLGTLDDDARTLLRRRRMGFVFQAFHLLPYLSVARNVALPLALNGMDGPGADQRIAELLAAVGLGDRGDSAPGELSGGEMQRVAIARALAHRPAVLLADEPTGNLDPRIAASVLTLLRDQVKRDGAAGIVVTHSAAAAATADRVYVLEGGRLRPGSGPVSMTTPPAGGGP